LPKIKDEKVMEMQSIKLCLNRGFAIMLVLMMLFLLFMLGVAFFFSAWTHAFMARNYLNMKRAFVVAEGGVHTAMGAIIGDFAWAMHAQNKPVDFRWRYGDNPQTPVEYAINPSYSMGKTLRIFNREVGLSGLMEGGAYGINSDIYHLKVNECSAQLYVNEGLGHPYNTAVMRRILNNLGNQLGIEQLGTRIMHHRPAQGYNLKSELKRVLGEHYDRVKDFLCVHTWSDPKVVNPVPLSEEAKEFYRVDELDNADLPVIYQTGARRHGNLPKTFYEGGELSNEVIAYSQKEQIPSRIDITSRAPVNINTAPKEILVALLRDLQGFFVLTQKRTKRFNKSWYESIIGHFPNTIYPDLYDIDDPRLDEFLEGGVLGEYGVIFRTLPVSKEIAIQLADLIIQHRPFRRYPDLDRLIDSKVWHFDDNLLEDPRDASQLNILKKTGENISPVPAIIINAYIPLLWDHYKMYASQAIADTIKANFNPNLHLNEINPDADLWGWVDKTDLITNSTEFCFLPTGYFEIESVGQILRAEWEPGRFHISPYLLIMKDSFEHNNQIMGQRRLKVTVKLWDLYSETSQKDFYRGSFSRKSDTSYLTSGNWGCESGPELNNGQTPFETDYEGYVTLSTVGGSLPYDQQRIKGKLYQTGPHIPDHFDLRSPGIQAGTKYRRDGFYADRGEHEEYNHFIPKKGTISYWIKPGFLPGLNGYPRVLLSAVKPGFLGNFLCDIFMNEITVGGWSLGYRSTWRYPIIPTWNNYEHSSIGFLFGTTRGWIPDTTFYEVTPALNRVHWHSGTWHGGGIGTGTPCPMCAISSGHTHSGIWEYYRSPLIGHRWLHVAFYWQYDGLKYVGMKYVGWRGWVPVYVAEATSGIWINGRKVSSQTTGVPYSGSRSSLGIGSWKWIQQVVVLGSLNVKESTTFVAHCTMDEFNIVDKIEDEEIDCECFFLDKRRVCQGGPGVPCGCEKVRRCKGGPGVPCICEPYESYFTCEELPPRNCYCSTRWYKRKCKGGIRKCGWRGKCWWNCAGGTSEYPCNDKCKCPRYNCWYSWTRRCDCEGTKRSPSCRSGCDCEEGLLDECLSGCECNKTGKLTVPVPPEEIRKQWWHGRYYRQNDAEFTSHQIDLAGGLPYLLAEPNPVTDPYGRPRWTGAEGVSEEVSKERWGKATSAGIRILGMAWTYRGWVQDYQGTEYGNDPKFLDYQLELSLYRIDPDGEKLIAGPFLNIDSGWAPVMYQLPRDQPAKFRYRVRFNTHCDPLNSILLESPILDDVTIYYTTRPVFLSWQEGY
jgi:hypothetical protein